MNLGKIDFREFDQHWVVLDKKKDIKKISKKLKIDLTDGLALGYIYISHEDGLQLKIVGNVIHEDETYSLDPEMIYKNTSIPFSKKLTYHILPIDKTIIKKINFTEQVEYHFESLYQKESLLTSRQIENLDSFRHERFIDDIEVKLKVKGKEEYLWARIEDCSKENLIFVCSLLNHSKYNKNYKENTLVLVKFLPNEKTIDLVIDGIVDRIKK